MQGCLLGTNVISEFTKAEPDRLVMERIGRVANGQAFLSVATVAELWYGAERLPFGRRRTQLLTWIGVKIPNQFGARILEAGIRVAGIRVARKWGQLKALGERQGVNRNDADCCIAATAEIHELTLVTRDVRHFAADSIDVIDSRETDI